MHNLTYFDFFTTGRNLMKSLYYLRGFMFSPLFSKILMEFYKFWYKHHAIVRHHKTIPFTVLSQQYQYGCRVTSWQ
jgi:hypothetical protein